MQTSSINEQRRIKEEDDQTHRHLLQEKDVNQVSDYRQGNIGKPATSDSVSHYRPPVRSLQEREEQTNKAEINGYNDDDDERLG